MVSLHKAVQIDPVVCEIKGIHTPMESREGRAFRRPAFLVPTRQGSAA